MRNSNMEEKKKHRVIGSLALSTHIYWSFEHLQAAGPPHLTSRPLPLTLTYSEWLLLLLYVFCSNVIPAPMAT